MWKQFLTVNITYAMERKSGENIGSCSLKTASDHLRA